MKKAKNTICLSFDGGAEEAAHYYAKTFPDSSVDAVHHAPGDFPSGKQGDVLMVEFTAWTFAASGLMAAPSSNTAKHSRFRSQRMTKQKLIVTGTRSLAMAETKVSAVGAKTNRASLGRLCRWL